MKRVFEYLVDDYFSGKNIKTLLKQHYHMSTNLITLLKKYEDGICVNGEHKRITYVLSENDHVTLTMYDEPSENIVPTQIELDILYEDDDIMVINKPPYLPTHPSMGNFENTLANGIMHLWSKRGEAGTFRAVNRLDKNTSGLLVIAKNAYSHARLCEQIQQGLLKRKYLCVVCGNIEDDFGSVNAPIARECDSVIKRCIREDGQDALTHYRVVKRMIKHTLIELELETGRTHQIRVHMASLGTPVVGDFLYGSTDESQRQLLHSYHAKFIHPVTSEQLLLECDMPKDMSDFINEHEKK